MTTLPSNPPRWPAPTRSGAGTGLAILVNANAKRGGRRVAVQIARALPGASVRLTKSAHEIDAWLRVLPPPRGVLAAGGDGTAVALVNALARVTPRTPCRCPRWACCRSGRATGGRTRSARRSSTVPRAARRTTPGRCPTRRCGLVEVEGTLAHFAGSGWDAMILDDYKQQLAASTGPEPAPLEERLRIPVGDAAAHGAQGRRLRQPARGHREPRRRGLSPRRRGPTAAAWTASGRARCSTTGRWASPRSAHVPSSATASGRSRSPSACRASSASRVLAGRARRGGDHPAPLGGPAPAAGHARLVRHPRPDDLLALGAAPDRRRRARDEAHDRVPRREPEHRDDRLAKAGVGSNAKRSVRGRRKLRRRCDSRRDSGACRSSGSSRWSPALACTRRRGRPRSIPSPPRRSKRPSSRGRP